MTPKKMAVISVSLVFVVLISSNCSYALSNDCNNDSLTCIYNNFEELYNNDYNRFWRILNEHVNKVKNCNKISDVVDFMKLSKLKTNNAEFTEFLNQQLEELCVSNKSCFMMSLAEMDTKTVRIIINKLKHPMFVDKSEINKVFKTERSNIQYKRLTEQYFSK